MSTPTKLLRAELMQRQALLLSLQDPKCRDGMSVFTHQNRESLLTHQNRESLFSSHKNRESLFSNHKIVSHYFRSNIAKTQGIWHRRNHKNQNRESWFCIDIDNKIVSHCLPTKIVSHYFHSQRISHYFCRGFPSLQLLCLSMLTAGIELSKPPAPPGHHSVYCYVRYLLNIP